jgi:uracil-DNA glycosylase
VDWDLEFWREPWPEIQEKLDGLDRLGIPYWPDRSCMYAPLDDLSLDQVKVCIVGQDPYPDPKFATGTAFSIPRAAATWPATLCSIIREYCSDLHYTTPTHGCLERWVEQGVLLWNACPMYSPKKNFDGKTVNGCLNWGFDRLTNEIMLKLNESLHGVVFVFLGSVARDFATAVDPCHPVILTSHPSPLGRLQGKHPFHSSRLFTSINIKLKGLDHPPIDWKLEGSKYVETA